MTDFSDLGANPIGALRNSPTEDWPPTILAGWLLALAKRHAELPPGPPGTVPPKFLGQILRAAAERIERPETAVPKPWGNHKAVLKFARNATPDRWPNDLLASTLIKMAQGGERRGDTDALIIRTYREAAIRLDGKIAIKASQS